MILTTAEAAEHLHVDEATIRSWVERGYLRPVMPGVRPLRFELLALNEAAFARKPKSWKRKMRGLADDLG